MSSKRTSGGNMVTRRHLQEIKLIPNQSDRAINIKISVDGNIIYELPTAKAARPLVWKDLMLPCDLSDYSTVAFRIIEVHTITQDRTSEATCFTSNMVEDDSLLLECDNKRFKMELKFMDQEAAKRVYVRALDKVQRIESRQSGLNTPEKLRSAFKTLLDLANTISELDPTGGAKVAFSVCSMVWERIEEQGEQDETLNDLIEQLAGLIPTINSVRDITNANLESTVIAMLNLIEDTSLFILKYKSRSTWKHILYSAIDSATQDRTRDILDSFKRLKEEYDTKVAAQTLVAAQLACKYEIINVETTLMHQTRSLDDQTSLDKLVPTGHASFNPDKACMPDTRVRTIDDILAWSRDFDSSQRLLWVYGFAGLGKSSIAASVCKRLEEHNLLAASFFCKRDDPAQRDARCVLNTIVYGLAMKCSAYKRAVAKAIQADSQICTAHMQRRYLSLVEKPLKTTNQSNATKGLVVVIDALDETVNDEHRSALLAYLRNMCSLVSWLKIVVSSRPDSDIMDAFGQTSEFALSRNIMADNAANDIHLFVRRRMAAIAKSRSQPEWPEDKVKSLAARASGLFIWAETACKFVDAGLDVDARLDQMLQLHQSTGALRPFAGLDELYATAIRSGIKDEDEDNKTTIRLCVGAIVATSSRAPLPMSDLGRLLSTQLNTKTLRTVVKALSSVLYEHSGPGGPVRIYHPSFEDYITDSTRSGDFYVDLRHYNGLLAKSSLETMLAELRFNICGLETSHILNVDVPGLDQRVQVVVPGYLRYSCLHWYGHVAQAETDSIVDQLKLFLFGDSLVYWIEVLSLLGELEVASTSMLGLSLMTRSPESFADCSQYATDIYRFVLSFYDAISASTPHLYISALPFTPRLSKLGQAMRPRFSNALAVTRGGEEDWTSCMRTISHPDTVFCAAFSPDGRRIVSACKDGLVRVWDAETGAAIMSLKGHTGAVTCVAYSSDGQRIASGSWDSTVRIWDSRTGSEVCEPLKGHSGPIQCLALSAAGKHLASGSNDHTVRIWNIETGMGIFKLDRHSKIVNSVAFSPNGRYIASGSDDQQIIIWDAETGAPILEPLNHTDSILSVAFSPNSSLVVSGSSDDAVTVWDRATLTIRKLEPFRHGNRVQAAQFSPGGDRIVSGSSDCSVRVWNTESGKEIEANLRRHSRPVWSVIWSPDGQRIASCSSDKTVRIWDAKADTRTSTDPSQLPTPINWVAYSHNGRLLATGSDDNVLRIWDAATGTVKLEPLRGHSDWVCSVAFSHDDCRIVSGSRDKTIRIWDVETGATVLGPLEGHSDAVESVALTSDSRLIASGSHDRTVRIWDAETGVQVLKPLTGHTDVVQSVAFSPDGHSLASGSLDQTIRVWDVQTGELRLSPLQGHTDDVTSVTFLFSGEYIVSCSSDSTVRIWDVSTGDVTRFLKQPYPRTSLVAVAVAQEGRHVVAGSYTGRLLVWDMDSDRDTAKVLYGHSNAVASIAVSPNDRLVASSSEDGTLRIWDAQKLWAAEESSLLLDDTDGLTTLEVRELARHASSDGWVKSPKGELLVWLPAIHRDKDDSLMCMTSDGVVPRSTVDLTRFVHGSNWTSVMNVE
ncbi:hypothetical protein FRC09_009877 [Ceratobasidium sp. 395]|nr:hypothetical protein FRC09_009877 [Ceratobasidium sp. 395]